jgi:MFS family permease
MNRFLQGFSSSLIQTTMYSVSTNFFPDHKEAMVGYIEAATGIGLILGPLIGSSLYSIGGYHFIYNFFGSTFVVFSFFIKIIFDDEIDKLNAASISSNSARLSDEYDRMEPNIEDVELGDGDDDFMAEIPI